MDMGRCFDGSMATGKVERIEHSTVLEECDGWQEDWRTFLIAFWICLISVGLGTLTVAYHWNNTD
jgi:hypothetical protein